MTPADSTALDPALDPGALDPDTAAPGVADLRALAGSGASAPVLARERVLPVVGPLAGLLPWGGIQRGTTVAVGSTSLALALVAEASRTGSWVAAVGLPALGLVAAVEVGVALERVAVVRAPAAEAWGAVLAALVGAFDVVLFPAGALRPTDGRRLVARARERGSALVVVDGPGLGSPAGRGGSRGPTPEPDVRLAVSRCRWTGLGDGHGHLRSRALTVTAGGRRAAARHRQVDLWFPAPEGGIALAVEAPVLVGPWGEERAGS